MGGPKSEGGIGLGSLQRILSHSVGSKQKFQQPRVQKVKQHLFLESRQGAGGGGPVGGRGGGSRGGGVGGGRWGGGGGGQARWREGRREVRGVGERLGSPGDIWRGWGNGRLF